MIRQVDDLKNEADKLDIVLRTNSINGRVLTHCDLMELRTVRNYLIYTFRIGEMVIIDTLSSRDVRTCLDFNKLVFLRESYRF